MLLAGAACVWGGPSPAAGASAIERLRGIYLQQAIELATVGDREVVLTRMTRFRKCGSRRGLAEDFNAHTVDVLGQQVAGIGFVAGIVNAIDDCPAAAPGAARGGSER